LNGTGDDRPLLSVRGLKKHFPVRRGILRRQVGAIRAVDDVSFDIRRGETLGLVGESGSGKSTVGRVMLALDDPTAGEVLFDGEDLAALTAEALRLRRRQMQLIFQDPYASLNPRLRVGSAIREPLDIHRLGTPRERDARVAELLKLVGLDASHAARFPHEFSGGQRQRVGIARALSTNPALIVADEPISALDVSIQAQIVNLLADLKAELGLTYLFIGHDLAMVRHLSDRVAVMYLGRIVETGDCDAVLHSPAHPYTQALIAAMPKAASATRQRPALRGEIPDPANPPSGCHFHTRCPFATDLCRLERPFLRNLRGTKAGHEVACHHAETIGDANNRETPSNE
jgi:oligopeptide/dipeptide ABC transporter ATP-binding protein